jgi:hypothetical protein
MPVPGPFETENEVSASMTDPHAESDVRNWTDRLGRTDSFLSADLARRMGLALRLVRPALEPLRDWLETPIEIAVYEAIRQAALRFHPRLFERYLRLQDLWPAEVVSLGGLFLLRILEEGSFASHEITSQLSHALAGPEFQDDPPAMINGVKSAEIDRLFDGLRGKDWKGKSLFGEKRRSLPETDRPMGAWVRDAFGSLFGEETVVANWDREVLAMTIVDEASPEMPGALRTLEKKGWRASTLLAFLLKENVNQAVWAEIQRHHVHRFGNAPGGDDPILSIGGYFDFLQELVDELDRVHSQQAMEQDLAFHTAVVTAMDLAQGWESPKLVDIYTWLMTKTEWKHPGVRQSALMKARQSPVARLQLGRRLIETALLKLGDQAGLERFSAAFTATPTLTPRGLQLIEHPGPDPGSTGFEASDETEANLYCLAMGWVSAVHGRMGIKAPQRVMDGIGLAMAEFSETDAKWVLEKGEFDPGLYLDVGALLHWGTLEESGERELFVLQYRERTGREGWFRSENVASFGAARRIIERRQVSRVGLFC